jgi:hypothetical protein
VLDDALHDRTAEAIGSFLQDVGAVGDLDRKRLYHPLKLGGGGRRRLGDILEAAYAGCTAVTIPKLIGTTSSPGPAWNQLSDGFGKGSFDKDEKLDWSTWFAADSPTASALKSAIQAMRGQLGVSDDTLDGGRRSRRRARGPWS